MVGHRLAQPRRNLQPRKDQGTQLARRVPRLLARLWQKPEPEQLLECFGLQCRRMDTE